MDQRRKFKKIGKGILDSGTDFLINYVHTCDGGDARNT